MRMPENVNVYFHIKESSHEGVEIAIRYKQPNCVGEKMIVLMAV